MSLSGTKALLASKTFWGLFIAAINPILQLFGFDVGQELSQITQSVIQLIGLIVALVGRITAKQRIGGLLPTKSVLGALLIPALLLTGCHPLIHPGAVSRIDSSSYDILLVAQAAIDQARLDMTAGKLPEVAKPPLNQLIQAYDKARESWLLYRGAALSQAPAGTYENNVLREISNLAQALQAFQNVKGTPQ